MKWQTHYSKEVHHTLDLDIETMQDQDPHMYIGEGSPAVVMMPKQYTVVSELVVIVFESWVSMSYFLNALKLRIPIQFVEQALQPSDQSTMRE